MTRTGRLASVVLGVGGRGAGVNGVAWRDGGRGGQRGDPSVGL